MFSKYKKKILFSAVAGALIFLAFSVYADFDKLLDAFKEFNWLFFPLILVLSFLNYIFRFSKWEYYRRILDIKLTTGKSFLIFLSAFVMSVTPGKMGEVLKSYLLKEENGTPVSKSAPIVVAERLTDFISIVFLCIVGAFVFDYGQTIIMIVGVVFISLTLLISWKKACLYFISLLEKIKFLSKHVEKFHTAYDSIYRLVRIKPLLIATVISVVSWFFECLGFYIVLNVFSSATNIEVSLLTATFIYGFSTLIGAIAMLPGGLGVTEASLTGLLQILKIPKNISVASTIIIRVATLWFAVVVGIFAVIIYQRLTHRDLEEIQVPNQA
ncbi:MAG: flippase-like domain-containing protein [Ignavibacteriae bacterium]|nr:flippase-like domain-containing protein [Ignavibacteriota bacterium]MCB9244396.1 flippase-like domain-containing protein [Ignavibacteriales bacterium]